ncbi:hypothetical protein COCOBI_01-8120 [Coccomyxa sp. Obi]|nr:hypothetical protein COCOBI_01-8120 [Coccomyxa sp. Obi]
MENNQAGPHAHQFANADPEAAAAAILMGIANGLPDMAPDEQPNALAQGGAALGGAGAPQMADEGADEAGEEEHFEVNEIIRSRNLSTPAPWFYISWENYGPEENSWVRLSDLDAHPLAFAWRSQRARPAAVAKAAYWTPAEATHKIEKSKHRWFSLKNLEVALDDVTSKRLAYERRKATRDARMNYAVAKMRKTWRTRSQKKTLLLEDADSEEMRCASDLNLYAAFLMAESGAPMDQPWIKKLLDVSNGRLDPHELLKIYRDDPGSLVANLYDPGQYRMTPEAESTPPLQSLSTCAAMGALVGRDNWRESPALQAVLQKPANFYSDPSR